MAGNPQKHPLQVWLVSEGNAGHTSQSKGLIDALRRRLPLDNQIIEAPMTLRGGFRPLLRWMLRSGCQVPLWVLRFAYTLPRLPANHPDMIVSSGGKSIPLAVSLARKYRAKFIFCGPPDANPLRFFDIILSPTPVPGHPHAILTEMLLTQVTPELVQQAGEDLKNRLQAEGRTRVGAVLIGGRSRSSHFETEDWRALAEGLNKLSVQSGWEWLVTTSRRTGEKAETILRETLKSSTLVDSAWWGKDPRKVVRSYLGACDAVFVTQDSLTMISEAICSGKPTITIRPKQVRASAYLSQVIDRQVSAGRLVSLQCDQLSSADEVLAGIIPLKESIVDDYALEVMSRLGINDELPAGKQ